MGPSSILHILYVHVNSMDLTSSIKGCYIMCVVQVGSWDSHVCSLQGSTFVPSVLTVVGCWIAYLSLGEYASPPGPG